MKHRRHGEFQVSQVDQLLSDWLPLMKAPQALRSIQARTKSQQGKPYQPVVEVGAEDEVADGPRVVGHN
ncbi:hypothetical protein RRF57_006942 [Xylaria bambusicola]|uniref:Uncharacterized protein n=1 Tax=Xylaria bambusicola TaxID=326684 RepID=A0AAN7UK48_9PEZI